MKTPVSLLSGYNGAWAEVTAIKARFGSGLGSYLVIKGENNIDEELATYIGILAVFSNVGNRLLVRNAVLCVF